MSNLPIWLTPIWLFSVGVAGGLIAVAAFMGLCWLLKRSAAEAMIDAIKEGILLPITYVAVAMTVLAVIAAPIMPVDRMLSSLERLGAVGTIEKTAVVPAGTNDFKFEVSFRADELQSYFFSSEQDIAISTEPEKGFIQPLIQTDGGDPYQWSPSSEFSRGFEDDVTVLYLSNQSDLDSEFTASFVTDVEMPEVHQLSATALSVIGLYGVYFLLRIVAPRASIVAAATAKEAVSQPLFILLTVAGVVALVSYVFIPYNTFGEDVKMLKTSGMTTIKVLAIAVALWTASVSIADEIEGRTALTVLSKPIGRRQFILGKFLGIVWPIVLMFVILGIVFLLSVSFKVVYDARESSKVTPVWQDCYIEVVRIIPGLVLAFLESVILAALSVAISTRLPMLPNLIICGSIYVLGHLGPLIVKSAAGEIVFVRFIGRLISVLLPVLDHFEIEGAIAGASTVPMEYLGYALVYSLLYCGVAMMLALIFFEDRDLA